LKKVYIPLILIILVPACSKQDEENFHIKIKKAETAETNEAFPDEHSEFKKDTSLSYIIGNTKVNIIKYNGKKQNYILLNVHENEKTSIETAGEIARKYGGDFLFLKSGGNRNISFKLDGISYTFDPNRIFSLTGIRKTLENLGRYSENADSAVNGFAEFILSHIIGDSRYIIAVHNNTDGSYAAN